MNLPPSIHAFLKLQALTMPAYGVHAMPAMKKFKEHFRAAVSSLVLEGAETLSELERTTRPWKAKTFEEVRPALIEETIDVFFFLLETWNMLGLDDYSIAELYVSKLEFNMKRVLISCDPEDARNSLHLAAMHLMLPYNPDLDIHIKDLEVMAKYDEMSYEDRVRYPALTAAYCLLWSMKTRGAQIDLDTILHDNHTA